MNRNASDVFSLDPCKGTLMDLRVKDLDASNNSRQYLPVHIKKGRTPHKLTILVLSSSGLVKVTRKSRKVLTCLFQFVTDFSRILLDLITIFFLTFFAFCAGFSSSSSGTVMDSDRVSVTVVLFESPSISMSGSVLVFSSHARFCDSISSLSFSRSRSCK